jgi:hypothetical protein
MKTLRLLPLILWLVACAPRGWSRPDTAEVQFSQDRYLCQQQAASAFPTSKVHFAGANQAPPQGQMVSGHYIAPSATQYLSASMRSSYDANSSNRDDMFKSCISSKGYRYGTKK